MMCEVQGRVQVRVFPRFGLNHNLRFSNPQPQICVLFRCFYQDVLDLPHCMDQRCPHGSRCTGSIAVGFVVTPSQLHKSRPTLFRASVHILVSARFDKCRSACHYRSKFGGPREGKEGEPNTPQLLPIPLAIPGTAHPPPHHPTPPQGGEGGLSGVGSG